MTKLEEGDGFMMVDEPLMTQSQLLPPPPELVTELLLDDRGETLLVATVDGQLIHWDVQDLDAPKLVHTYRMTDAGGRYYGVNVSHWGPHHNHWDKIRNGLGLDAYARFSSDRWIPF